MENNKFILGLTKGQAMWTGIGLLTLTISAIAGISFYKKAQKKKEGKLPTASSKKAVGNSPQNTRSQNARPQNTSKRSIQLVDPNDANPFLPSFFGYAWDWVKHQIGGRIKKLSESEAEKKAKIIEDAWSIINDDEDAIYKVFRGLGSKADVSRVAAAYEGVSDETLYEALKGRLHETEFAKVKAIVAEKEIYQQA